MNEIQKQNIDIKKLSPEESILKIEEIREDFSGKIAGIKKKRDKAINEIIEKIEIREAEKIREQLNAM